MRSIQSKIVTEEVMVRERARVQAAGQTLVFTNGCFDILHPGHVVYLSKAKKLGDILVVGLNSDASVRKIKGRGRPINNEKARGVVLSALSCVDYISIFSENTPECLIGKLKPDILVKGGDWKGKQIAGSCIVRAQGGRVVTVPFVKGFSTTSLIKKMAG